MSRRHSCRSPSGVCRDSISVSVVCPAVTVSVPQIASYSTSVPRVICSEPSGFAACCSLSHQCSADGVSTIQRCLAEPRSWPRTGFFFR
eukprot:5229935-Prymnesium_polylepis.1